MNSACSSCPWLRLILLTGATAVAGCDRDATDIARELDAAREGCTEQALEAGAEECVEMFEKYLDMGSEAVATYIGAMRALDEAVQRRGGVQFDTAGLGRAMSPAAVAEPPHAPEPAWRTRDQFMDEAASEPFAPALDPYDEGSPTYRPAAPDQGRPAYPEDRYDEPAPEAYRTDPRAPIRDVYREDDLGRNRRSLRRPDRQRGVLRPPEERLRRPWIGGERPSEDYYPEPGARDRADDPFLGPGDVTPSAEPSRRAPPYPY